jgi:hypothetical protein
LGLASGSINLEAGRMAGYGPRGPSPAAVAHRPKVPTAQVIRPWMTTRCGRSL